MSEPPYAARVFVRDFERAEALCRDTLGWVPHCVPPAMTAPGVHFTAPSGRQLRDVGFAHFEGLGTCVLELPGTPDDDRSTRGHR